MGRKGWLFVTLVGVVFITTLYVVVYVPTLKFVEENSLHHFTHDMELQKTLMDLELIRIRDGAKSISSRSMIRNKIVEYKQGKISQSELIDYTREKYTDGVKVIENCTWAVRMVDTLMVARYGEIPAVLPSTTGVFETLTIPTVNGNFLDVYIISPIQTRDGTIIGYDMVGLQNTLNLNFVKSRRGSFEIIMNPNAKEKMVEGNVLVTDGIAQVIYTSRAGNFSYIFYSPNKEILKPYHDQQTQSAMIVGLLSLLFSASLYVVKLRIDNRHRRTELALMNEVNESYQKFQEVFNSSPVGIAVINKYGNILNINKALIVMIGVEYELLMETTWSIMHYFFPQELKLLSPSEYSAFLLKMNGHEIRIENDKAQAVHLMVTARQIQSAGDYYILLMTIDLTELNNSKEMLEHSLQEKSMLLQEVHHRVKNNLAVISGLMQLQSYSTDNEFVKEQLLFNVTRIKAIADVHEMLYGTETFSSLNLSENLKKLLDYLQGMLERGKEIRIQQKLEPVVVGINQAVPIALIINEVVTNCFKHAFAENEKGSVQVRLFEKEEKVVIEIEDDGKGISPECVASDSSMGMQLIQAISTQLEGEFKYQKQDQGTIFRLRFTKEKF